MSDILTRERTEGVFTLTADPNVEAWAASTFEHYGTKISFSETVEVREWELEGVKLRKAFQIVVSPASGKQRFRIWLWKGATDGDLACAKRLIERAKNGDFDHRAWTFVPADERGVDRYVFSVGIERRKDAWCDNYVLKPCTDSDCVEEYHEWLNGDTLSASCSLEAIVHPDGFYVVHGSRAPDEKWEAWVDTSDIPEGHAGVKALRNCVNDLAWMQGECDRLNKAVEE